MTTMTGADSSALRDAAAQLDGEADAMDQTARALASSLGSLNWIGQVAVRFVDVWNSQHQTQLYKTSGFLRENATRLREQADQQDRAANADGSSRIGPFDSIMPIRPNAETLAGLERMQAIADDLADDVQRVRGLTPDEQVAWWNSLSAEQRAALLMFRPGELTALSGLPADVLQQARSAYESSIAIEVVTSDSSISGEVSVNVRWAKVGAGFELQQTQFADGHVEIDLGAYLKAGVSAEFAEAYAKAGLSGVYSFDSEADADAFIRGLASSLKPDNFGDAGTLIAGGVAAYSAKEIMEYLSTQRSHLTEVTFDLSVGSGIDVGNAELEEIRGASISRNTDKADAAYGDITATIHGSMSGGVNTTMFGASGSAEASASMIFSDSRPTSISIDYEVQSGAGGGYFGEMFKAVNTAEGGFRANVTLDLTDPAVAAAAPSIVAAIKRGDVDGATAVLAQVMDRSQIVVQTFVEHGFETGVDAWVVEGSLEGKTSTTLSTFIKPPGGAVYQSGGAS